MKNKGIYFTFLIGLFLIISLNFLNPAEFVYTDEYFNYTTLVGEITVGTVPAGIYTNNTFIWIVDTFLKRVQRYYLNGTYIDYSTIPETSSPHGITGNNTYIWITDTGNERVYRYFINMTYSNTSFDIGSIGNTDSGGITHDNERFYIINSANNRIYKYFINGTANSYYRLTPENSDAIGLTTNNTFIWVGDYVGDGVYKYYMNGTYTGTFFNLSSMVDGINPHYFETNNTFIWVCDIVSKKIYKFYLDYTDTTPPTFTTIPNNSSIIYTENISVEFIAEDDYLFDNFAINDTRFKIFSNGTLVNNLILGVGNYAVNVTINDSLNNINWTIYTLQVNKSSNTFGVYFNTSSPITYPETFITYTNCSTPYKIYLNGTEISNGTTINGGVTAYNISVFRTDTQNYTNIFSQEEFRITKSLEQCQVLFNETSPLEYTNTFKVWANCTSPFVLSRNGTTISNNSEQDLSVSAYNFSLQRNDTANYTYIFNESQFIVTDTTKPVLTIINPIDGESFTSGTIDLNFSVTDNGIGLDMCWYQNHTGNQTINCSLNTTISQSVDGTYTIYMFANDTYGNLATDSHTWTLSANAPAVNLNYPPIANYFNTNNTLFNFTATDTNGIDTCQLWINSTGTWHKNQTLTSVTSGVQTSFNSLNFTDNYYIWNVWCNDSTGLPGTSAWATLNRSFTIDTTYPNITINSITTTAGSQTISFNSTENDTNLNSCKYSIYNSSGMIDGTNENVSMVCNTNPHSATVTAYGVYVLRVYGLDLAGNEDYSELAFITSASTGTTITGGGGGGESGITREKSQIFEITSLNYLDKLDISLAKDSVRARTKNFYITNKGSLPVTLIISCESVNSSICDYVEIPEKTIVVSPNENEPYLGTLTLLTPENSSIGDAYYFNILVTSTEEGTEYYSKLSVSSKVSFLAYIYKYSYLFKTEKTFLVALPSLFFSILLFIFTLKFFGKRKMEVAGFFLSVIILLTSFFLGLILL